MSSDSGGELNCCRCITNTYNIQRGAGGTNKGARRPPNTRCAHACVWPNKRHQIPLRRIVSARFTHHDYPKPTNEMAHLDGWTTSGFPIPACDLVFLLQVGDGLRTDRVILKETRSKVN